jgi:hypothetical protein
MSNLPGGSIDPEKGKGRRQKAEGRRQKGKGKRLGRG